MWLIGIITSNLSRPSFTSLQRWPADARLSACREDHSGCSLDLVSTTNSTAGPPARDISARQRVGGVAE